MLPVSCLLFIQVIAFGLSALGEAPAHPGSPLKVGDVGVVLVIDSQRTVHAVWPGGRHWGLVPGLNSWELVSDGNTGPSVVTRS